MSRPIEDYAPLGAEDHGCWQLAPVGGATKSTRRYQPDTLVLETQLKAEGGAVRLAEFMPAGDGGPSLVRIVEGVRGRVAVRSDMRLRFDHGSLPPWCEPIAGGSVSRVGPDMVVLRTSVPLRLGQGSQRSEFTVAEGERVAFALSYGRRSVTRRRRWTRKDRPTDGRHDRGDQVPPDGRWLGAARESQAEPAARGCGPVLQRSGG